MDQVRSQVKEQGRFQFTGVTHPAQCGLAFRFERRHAARAGKIKEGRGTENLRISFPGILDHIHQERGVAAVSVHQVKPGEAADRQRIHHGQPEILKHPAAGIERARE